MSADSYFYLNEKSVACGPFTADQMRAMVATGQLTPETLAAVPDNPEWVPIGTLITLSPSVRAAGLKAVRAKQGWRASSIVALALVVIVLGGLGYAAVRWLPKLKDLAAKKEETPVAQPHALARWYLFGYFQGSQQAKMDAVFGKKPEASRADLAYALRTLGVPDPAPQHFALCADGYEDGMQNKPQRHVLQKGVTLDDGFPAVLEGIFAIPTQEMEKEKLKEAKKKK